LVTAIIPVGRRHAHDRDTEMVSRGPVVAVMSDALRSTLDNLRLEGALFFRGELSEPFEFESTPLALADALVPGADRLTLFHIVASGSCWVPVDDGVRYWADAGDVIVMPYADYYVMGGEAAAESVSILSLLIRCRGARCPCCGTVVVGGAPKSSVAICIPPIRCSTRR
jgi:Cupin